MNEYNTIFYETIDGKMPAKEFLLSLDYDMRAKMIRTLEMLQRNGPALREPQSKELELAKAYRKDYYTRKEPK